jgi:hypothetical protein
VPWPISGTCADATPSRTILTDLDGHPQPQTMVSEKVFVTFGSRGCSVLLTKRGRQSDLYYFAFVRSGYCGPTANESEI